jgi:hypothetical protein
MLLCKWKVHNGKIEIISFVVKLRSNRPHCQFRGVGQCMKHTYLYLWYPLFQAQYMRSTKSPNLELFSERISSI